MEKTETTWKRMAENVGAWLFISWILIVGPVGFVLLSALAYAMHFSNLALGIVCVLLLCSPLLFLAVWIPLAGAAVIAERMEERVAPSPLESSP